MKAFIFDTETTGLFKFFHRQHTTPEQMRPYPHVIELFGHSVIAEDGSATNEVEFLCEPKVPVTEEITRITGIKPEQVAGLPSFGTHIDKIIEVLSECDAIVAHNLTYDLQMLEVEFKRVGRWPELKALLDSRRKICTIEQSMHYQGRRLNLTKLHEHLFGEGFPDAHRARNDVEALTRCFLEMFKRGDI